MKGYVLTVEKTVPAPPEVVFDILADASRHHLIDGSGMLQGAKQSAPQRLVLGSTFGMGMKMLVNYSTLNRVVEFEDNRRIAWKTGPTGFVGKLMGGRVWRYELAPVDGGSKATTIRTDNGMLPKDGVLEIAKWAEVEAVFNGHRERVRIEDDPRNPGRASLRPRAASARPADHTGSSDCPRSRRWSRGRTS